MAKRKRKKNRVSFKKSFLNSIKSWNFDWLGPSLIKLFKVAFIVGLIVGIGISLRHIDKKYIRPVQSKEMGPIVLKKPPRWLNDELADKIFETAGGIIFQLNENTAATVRENLKSMSWLDDVSVQTSSDGINIFAQYRKPIAMIQSGPTKFFVDANQVVLDYVSIPALYIVEIKLTNAYESLTPIYGEVWKRNDLAAALQIIEKIQKMDEDLNLKKPLISEIASIDVSNYRGIKSRSNPHIILYSNDNTPIHWGAEIGGWQKEMESPDRQKIAKLYRYYEQEGTLSCGQKVNFINLRDPLVKIPLPGDKF